MQQKTQPSASDHAAIGPTPDVMAHLYRNPAGIRCMGSFMSTALVTRMTLATMLPLIALLLSEVIVSARN